MHKKTNKANKKALIKELKDVINFSMIDTNKDEWIVDSINNLVIYIFDNETMVGYYIEHKHFGEIYGHEENMIEETALFIKKLLSGKTKFIETYRGKKQVRIEVLTQSNNSNKWEKIENILTAIIRPLIHFSQKTFKNTVIEFKQQ